MGCFQSTLVPPKQPLNHANGAGDSSDIGDGTSALFLEFSLQELKAATDNFSSKSIVSEGGEKAPNVVYRGRLQNRRLISVKKFSKLAWPDPKQFAVIFINFMLFLCVGCFFYEFDLIFLCFGCRRKLRELGNCDTKNWRI